MGLIFNKQRKNRREAKHYYHTTVLYGDEERDILLTQSDVKRGIYRAQRNQEDIPRKWYQFWR
jgi:hypothetical protein